MNQNAKELYGQVKGPLDGMVVVEIATVIMGPLAGRLFAKLGAEVIHVEAPSGDVIRRSGQSRNPGMSGAALSLGDGKKNITLDFADETDQHTLTELIRIADLIVTNYLPRQRQKFGFDWDSVSEINPKCVLVTAQGFSSNSQYADRPAYDDIIQAASGLTDVYQKSQGRPQYAPYVVADKVCALSMVYSGLAAIHRRHVTGRGQWVDVPMFDVMSDFNLVEQLNDYSFSPPLGEAGWHRTINPARRPHPTTDGWVCVLPYNDRQWRDFLSIDNPSISGGDVPYPTNRDRNAHVEDTQALIAEFAARRSTAEVIDLCHEYDIPAQAVNTIEDLVNDAYLTERGSVEMIDHPSEGRYWRSTPNFGFSESPLQPVAPASQANGDRDLIMDLIEQRRNK
ncbi:CaiB/BaiF CoA transferase family protein [Brevibacterium renqingii]|uniref:CaiB/BaiF CoA transferase family protein n=1 Tax=Brevibacterium renqingii TaxID=2776916 RepID=UPI001AE0825D|nr:CoA transferase [Brevibacterium renqingii]